MFDAIENSLLDSLKITKETKLNTLDDILKYQTKSEYLKDLIIALKTIKSKLKREEDSTHVCKKVLIDLYKHVTGDTIPNIIDNVEYVDELLDKIYEEREIHNFNTSKFKSFPTKLYESKNYKELTSFSKLILHDMCFNSDYWGNVKYNYENSCLYKVIDKSKYDNKIDELKHYKFVEHIDDKFKILNFRWFCICKRTNN